MSVVADLIFRIHAVSGPEGGAAFEQAAQRLKELVKQNEGQSIDVELSRRLDWSDAPQPGALVIASIGLELENQYSDLAALKKTWLERIHRLRSEGCSEIFLMTIFPYIAKPERVAERENAVRRLEKIRRLNLMAVELSHEAGVSIIDVGRWFSAIGGALLQTDYRVTGARAQWIVAELTIVTILEAGFDRHFAPPPTLSTDAKLGQIMNRLVAMDRVAS